MQLRGKKCGCVIDSNLGLFMPVCACSGGILHFIFYNNVLFHKLVAKFFIQRFSSNNMLVFVTIRS